MFTHCLLCRTPFPDGTLVEHLPVGRRVAYDPEQGRLWVVCDACGGWTLAPILERWEAMEELERVVTDGKGAELAARTENVALFTCGRSQIVRVGETGLEEEAAWRYGAPRGPVGGDSSRPSPFAPRRLTMGEWLLGAAYALRTRLSGTGGVVGHPAVRRWVRYGSVAWHGEKACAACGHSVRELTYFECRSLILRHGGDEALTPYLVRACPRCGNETAGGLHFEGADAELVLRRLLAYEQDGGVSAGRLEAALRLVEDGGGAPGLSGILVRYGRYVGDLPRTCGVALRIMANDARERRLLALEAAELERQWRKEEELASIVDSELTPFPRFEAERRKLRGL